MNRMAENLTDYIRSELINAAKADPDLSDDIQSTTFYEIRDLADPVDLIEMYGRDRNFTIFAYSILFMISTIANFVMIILITKKPLRLGITRVDILLTHLAIANLLVTFLMMPVEIFWAYTIKWQSTDLVCHTMMFFREFGIYLTSFLLVCIAIDRYQNIRKPYRQPPRIMLAISWTLATICCLPQALIFHLETHPYYEDFHQCVSFQAFKSQLMELAYNIATIMMMFALPSLFIIFFHAISCLEISSKIRNVTNITENTNVSDFKAYRCSQKFYLRMSLTMSLLFILCWTPFCIIYTWSLFDEPHLSITFQKVLFIFATAYSSMNPVVYIIFHICGRLSSAVPATPAAPAS